jgi:hypothetical protein
LQVASLASCRPSRTVAYRGRCVNAELGVALLAQTFFHPSPRKTDAARSIARHIREPLRPERIPFWWNSEFALLVL